MKILTCFAKKTSKRTILILLGITVLGGFLRLYHFSDWLHFELDQARDTLFVSEAVRNGPQELPLLGPKASGTALRTGPAFYYLEYLSALFFGDTPQGHALFVPLLSVLSIPLLYLLFVRFFPTALSLGLTYLYAISAFFVLHQRFAWNPNILPFFLIAGFLCFLYSLDQSSRRPGRWLMASSFFLTIATQLHFVAFFAIPFFVATTLAIRRPQFSLRAWVFALFFIPGFLYLPVFVNEWAFHGENTKAFFDALSSKKEKEGLVSQIAENVLTQSQAYALILTGNERIVLPSLTFKNGFPKISCADYCRKTPGWMRVSTILFFIIAFIAFLITIRKQKGDWLCMGLWFIAIFLTFTGIASQLAPRFFPLLIPLPYFFLGALLLAVRKKSTPVFHSLLFAILLLCTFTNFSLLVSRASELRQAKTHNVNNPTDRILEEPIRVTYEQQKEIAAYLVAIHNKNGFPVFIDSESFWRRSIKYIAERDHGISFDFLFPANEYKNTNTFIILRTKKSGDSVFEKYADHYNRTDKKEFGTITVHTLTPKEGVSFSENPPITKPILETDGGDIARITWKDAFQALMPN